MYLLWWPREIHRKDYYWAQQFGLTSITSISFELSFQPKTESQISVYVQPRQVSKDQEANKNKNTSILVRNARMQFLHKSAKFTNNVKDLKQIYISQVRSKLEQSAVVWHSSLTKKNESDLERVQKAALRIILRNQYQHYSHALSLLQMKSLKDRRDELCLKFAKKCLVRSIVCQWETQKSLS